MKRNILRAIAAAALIALAATPAFSQEEPAMSARELDAFIRDWPAVAAWFEARGTGLDEDLSGAVAAYLTGADFEAFIRGKGWKPARFDYVAGAALAGLAYVHMEKSNPDLVKELDAAIAEARANPALDADTKAQMVAAFEEAKKGLFSLSDDADLGAAELSLVRARYDELARLFGLEE